MRLEKLILLVLAFMPATAKACDYYDAKVDGGLGLTLFHKGSANYSYSEPAYAVDTFALHFNAPADSGTVDTIGYINITVDWPKANSAADSLKGQARWELLLYWGDKPPPQGSTIKVIGDKTELALLKDQRFPRNAGDQLRFDKYYPEAPVPDFRRYRRLTVEIIAPDGKVHLREQFVLPNWKQLPLRLKAAQARLVRISRSEDSMDRRECGMYPVI